MVPPAPPTMRRSNEEIVTATEAKRRFSDLLRRVRQGTTIIVTSRGKRVARLVPVDLHDHRNAGAQRAALLTRLRKQRAINVGRWTRDELYEDD
jgi:prevent-host-death family protein